MMRTNRNFQLGLLHFVHLLVNVDGRIDDRERAAILTIREEENIQEAVILDFENYVLRNSEQEIYRRGAELLNACTEDEKIGAFVHLHGLAEVDSTISSKEARFLIYSLKLTNIDLDEVIVKSALVKASRKIEY